MRGGYRPRRWITREDALVSCPGGRWGRRRTRVTECWAVLTAEVLYTWLLESDQPMVAGGRGSAIWHVDVQSRTFAWEIRPNAVWRHGGRAFFMCGLCQRRAARLYLPLENSWLACRRCWGLTYASRSQNNYKDSGEWLLAVVGATHRSMAHMNTAAQRDRNAAASFDRWADRRRILAERK
jgi:hypothetical protein